tara:strand:+ start:392 stop:1027 length:636 start_codon:yes stop_codon:yes gene_type:complete
MAKGPNQENFQVSESTKTLASLYKDEKQTWRQVWSPVMEDRLQQAAEKNVASVVRGRAAKSVMNAFQKAGTSPYGLATNVTASADLAIGSVKNLQEANRRVLGLSNKAQTDALKTAKGFSAIGGSALSAASRFDDSAIMAQNSYDTKVNTSRAGISKAVAKAAGSVAGGFTMHAALPKENNFNIGAMPSFMNDGFGNNQYFNKNNIAYGNT